MVSTFVCCLFKYNVIEVKKKRDKETLIRGKHEWQ